jgi:hypothetical protein
MRPSWSSSSPGPVNRQLEIVSISYVLFHSGFFEHLCILVARSGIWCRPSYQDAKMLPSSVLYVRRRADRSAGRAERHVFNDYRLTTGSWVAVQTITVPIAFGSPG